MLSLRKKRPETKQIEADDEDENIAYGASFKSAPKSIEAMFASGSLQSEMQKKKKKVKKGPAEKKTNAEKLDLSINIEMADTNIDAEEEEMIVLPDLNMGINIQEEVKKKKQIDPSQIRTTKKNQFCDAKHSKRRT